MSAAHAALSRPAPARAAPARPAARPVAAPVRAPGPITSLSAVPAVQPMCADCAAEERLPVQPRLKVGPAGDRFEREADAIAAHVMAAPEIGFSTAPAPVSAQRACASCGREEPRPLRAPAGVQPLCAACAAEREARRMPDGVAEEEPRARRAPRPQEEEEAVQPRRAPAGPQGGAAPGLAAQAAELTSGGAPMPGAARAFYESRLGRDLSGVRLHSGARADALNASIAARAFTYRDHIWLGAGEGAGPSFTMAHELAHVLQQTAPGPIGAPQGGAASSAPETAQPKRNMNAYWTPLNSTAILRLHTAMHDAAQKAMRKTNPGMLSEVPMPGSNREVVDPSRCGFADLYLADRNAMGAITAPGLEKLAAPVPGGLPVGNFTSADATSSCAGRPWRIDAGGKRGTSQNKLRWPRINKSGAIYGLANAPKNILIGEMKPGHNPDYREKGETQVTNYVKGLKAAVAATNTALSAQTPPRRWDAGTIDVMRGTSVKLPAGWDPDGDPKSGWGVPSIKLRSGRLSDAGKMKMQDLKPWGAKGTKRKTAIRGRWSLTPDPDNAGVFTYFLWPHPQDLATAMGSGLNTAAFKGGAAKLQKVLGCLKASPKSPSSVCRMPLPAARPAAAMVRATPKAARSDDSFSFAKWNALRVGGRGHANDNLKAEFDAGVKDDLRAQIDFRGMLGDWYQDIPDFMSGAPEAKAYDASNRPSEAMMKESRQLDRFAFWTHPAAAVFGRARAAFGTLFVRGLQVFESLRDKVKERFGGRSFTGGPGGAISKAAKTVAKLVLTQIGKLVAPKVIAVITDCAEKGFRRKMAEMMEGSALEDLIASAAATGKTVEKIKDDTLANIETLRDSILGDLETGLKPVLEEAKTILAVISTAAEIARAVRIGICLGGLIAAPETAGASAVIGCVLSVADYIASKFGMSPVDMLIGSILKSCDSQRLVAKAMLSVDVVRDLPTKIGRWAVGAIRDVLKNNVSTDGFAAEDLLCKPDEITIPPLDAAAMDCVTEHNGRRLSDTPDLPADVPLSLKPDWAGPTDMDETPGKVDPGGEGGAGGGLTRAPSTESGKIEGDGVTVEVKLHMGIDPTNPPEKGDTPSAHLSTTYDGVLYGPSPAVIHILEVTHLHGSVYEVTFTVAPDTILRVDYVDENGFADPALARRFYLFPDVPHTSKNFVAPK